MNRNFNDWFSKFKSSISNYSYYVNFDKIYEQADKYKVELNILNSLIGSKNIEEDFENIIVKYPETLEVIPMLLAVRSNEIFIKDKTDEYLFKFNKLIYSIEDYIKFMRETGLFELLQNHIINNFLIPYYKYSSVSLVNTVVADIKHRSWFPCEYDYATNNLIIFHKNHLN